MKFSFLVTATIKNVGPVCQTQFWKGTTKWISQPSFV